MGKGSQWTEARRRELPLMGVRFFLAAALCAARIGGGEAPFALGCVAAAGPGAGGIAALLGCGMGLALFLDFASGLIQLGSAILIAAAMTALQGTKLAEKRGFAPVCSGGLYFAVKGIWVLRSADPAAGLPLCLLTAALCGLSAWGYVPLLRGRQPEEEGLRFLGLTLLAALGAAEPAGLSLGGVGVMALAVLTAWRQGTAKALETGLLGGFLLDCRAGAGLRYAAACALAGLLAGEAAKGRKRRLAPALAAGLSGGILLLYVLTVLPLWFKRPNPVIFVPVDFAAIILYLLYIDLATGGHWFLTFAFPVAGSIGALITTMVALLRYVRRGYLYIFGGALIAAGGLAMLLEFLLNLTFGVHQTFFWSFYPLAAGVLLGVMLIIIAVCPPLRRSLHRKFFL